MNNKCGKWGPSDESRCDRPIEHLGRCNYNDPEPKSKSSQFEHKIIELRLYATEAELDVLGDEGWHLVSESLHEDQVRYVFCRAKQA